MDSASDAGIDSLTSDVFDVTSDVVGVVVRANRSLDTLNAMDSTMNGIINRTNIVSH